MVAELICDALEVSGAVKPAELKIIMTSLSLKDALAMICAMLLTQLRYVKNLLGGRSINLK